MIQPGDELVFEYIDWPVATLTVVSVRLVTAPSGATTHAIRTTSDHPGPSWSSYDRDWWEWFVLEHMRRIPGPPNPGPPITDFSQPALFDPLEAHA